MKRLLIILAFFICSAAIGQPKVVKLPDLLSILETTGEEIHVINFWATWCGPCVAEMPLFEAITKNQTPGVKVTLVSMDLDLDPNPEKVYRFVNRKKLVSNVLILDEKDPGSYIDKIEPQWSGSLPATIVVNRKTGKRKFVGTALHAGDLEKLIEEVKAQ